MVEMTRRNEVIEAAIALVAATTGFACASEVHGDWVAPYVLVTMAGGPAPLGDFGSRNSNATQRIAVTAYAADRKQVNWIMDKTEAALTANNSLNIGEQWVLQEVQGAIVPSGETLYSGTDNYLVRK